MSRNGAAAPRKAVSLTALPVGRVATITRVVADGALGRRLLGLGIRPGKRVEKIGTMFLGGPITLRLVGGGSVALGRGLAERVFAEVEP